MNPKEKIAETDTSKNYDDNEIDVMMKDCEEKLDDLYSVEGGVIRT